MTLSAREKFQILLRDLFQFDCADLDFGIYRIMNHKRQVIERFIAEDLPKAIAEELSSGALAEQAQAQEALQAARQKVLDALGDDALDADGNLAEAYRATKAGKEYLEAQTKAQGARSTEALEAAIYNHLYTFFSRYWQDGDFISKRRYSKKERYAIPYNGEEVYLYWANHDQYYVKTGEYFTDYSYKAPNGVTVRFELRQADVEQNNVKGEKRFFLPALDGVAWDEAARTLTIPFEFRPLTAQETIAYGQKNQQETIIAKAVAGIPERVKAPEAQAALTAERRRTDKGESVSWLEHHLRQYTRRNTSDFFIHKDLRGFLSRELDFYLKNEVLNLEEMETAGEGLTEGWFQLLRLIKRVGFVIIDFLAQIEDFQKMLWEKKKFVAETFYVITVGNIPAAFYPEIADCEAQWEEWRTLLAVETPQGAQQRVEFLTAHPTLPLDTRRFSQDFTDHLLASFDNLDEITDGLLVHSENWQALNLLQEKYRERVKCIYIDPPFNLGTNADFPYKTDYKDSSWASLLQNRLEISRTWLHHEAVIFVRCDYNGNWIVRPIMDNVFWGNFQNEIILNRFKKKSGVLTTTTESLFLYSMSDHFQFNKITKPRVCVFCKQEIPPEWQWAHSAGESDIPRYFTIDGQRVLLYPPKGRHWTNSQDVIDELEKQGRIRINKSLSYRDTRGNKIPFMPEKLQSSEIEIDSNWTDIPGYEFGVFSTEKFSTQNSEELLERVILSGSNEGDIVLDYFLGSATTTAVAQKLNRKWIGIEMGNHFDSVILPRMKRVWSFDKSGISIHRVEKAQRNTVRRIFKVIRLESYEDALNNLTFDNENEKKALERFKDDYLLHYMLKWETRHSETLLDVEKLQTPFAYKLRLHRDGETRERLVDLPETFNYLLGLDVQTRKTHDDKGRRYLVYRGTLRNGRNVAIIWRETQGWTKEDYERDRDFAAEQKLTAGADEVFVNGDSLIPGAQSLDPIFKERMFAGMER